MSTPAEKLQPELAYMKRATPSKNGSPLFLKKLSPAPGFYEKDRPASKQGPSWKRLARQEMPLIASWLILAFYLSSFYLTQAEKLKVVQGEVYEIRHVLEDKIEQTAKQNTSLQITTASLSEGFASHENKFNEIESQLKFKLDQQNEALQKMKQNLDEAQAQLAENSKKMDAMEETRRQEMELISKVLRGQNGSVASSAAPSAHPAPEAMMLVNLRSNEEAAK